MRSEVTVPVGGSVVLECFAGGAPQPYIAWFKGTARVRSDSHVVFAESGQMLVIAEADEDDGGSYTCEATNSQGTVSHGVELIIETGMCRAEMRVLHALRYWGKARGIGEQHERIAW